METSAGVGPMEAMMGIFFLVLSLVAFIVWVWALIDCIRSRTVTGSSKVIWLLVIFFTYTVGAIAYLVVSRMRPAVARLS